MHRFEEWDVLDAQAQLEAQLGKDTVVFSNVQTALCAVLEILGTRVHPIPVALPITAPPEVIAGVLRSGADPLLLDIHPDTLQIDPDVLKFVIDDLNQNLVIILTLPDGRDVDSSLLELAADIPSIVDARVLPRRGESLGTFTLWTARPILSDGAVVTHRYVEQLRELRMARSGLLGCRLISIPSCANTSQKGYSSRHKLVLKSTRKSSEINFSSPLKKDYIM
ncbi:hypothetical protein HC928_11650 [bacterium]|nr:hypothetical protein [bacterium]